MQHEALLLLAFEGFQTLRSSVVPRVAVTSACVSPRVKSAEPWVRGRTPTSMEICADLVKGAAVGANAILGDLLAEDALAQRFVVLAQLLLGVRRSPSGSSFASSSLICLTSA